MLGVIELFKHSLGDMSQMKKLQMAIIALSILTGCITLSSDPVSVVKLGEISPSPRELSVLNGTPYLAEMTLALSQQGIKVRPITSQETITEQRTPTISAQWSQATTRYAMIVQIQPTRQICAFTDYRIVNATVNIVDIKTNESVAVLKQRGSDGPCSTVTPVFNSLASEIAKLWSQA